mmetsp:Transcript_22441/g.49037  ORF Transcript_22441/g.49037 Transcript_22441/m.49037 type:complete len:405 (+) Transcript_22441:43-1257(+)|eukprot:CAMPEP_0204390932 /NCGR_PEP_ID=MMETSP0469-20131031/60990_1 /ASSEMBLY_ACC=CAM_ASM_000384 /TAXON_ID=2969 /ORGANISM="Oxyrrhis marina" /LENGTH=404 /DNA_ID=CAMNT_0051384877 /DNA_START=35 /DNA_END=1249 /DNA_ORIENTATION=+
MAAIVCTSCLVQFDDAGLLRSHYKCDWHLYNAKRKLQSLPPIPQDVFEGKAAAIRAQDAKGKKKGTDHLLDKTREPKPKPEPRYEELEEGDTGDDAAAPPPRPLEEPWVPGQSLFDNTKLDTFEESLEYMWTNFSFFIPDVDYCMDKEGLVRQLASLIQEPPHICIQCSSTFKTASGCRKHMLAKGHTQIGSSNDEMLGEMEPFYDFRTSIKELILKGKGKDRVKEVLDRDAEKDKAALEAADNKDESKDAEGSGGEDGEESEADEDGLEVVECENEEEFKKVMEELGLQRAEILPSGDLQLPDGSVATHRQWAYIYRQKNLHLSGRKLLGTQILALEDAKERRQHKGLMRDQNVARFATPEEKRHRKYMIAVLKSQNKIGLKVADMAPLMYRRRKDKRILVTG